MAVIGLFLCDFETFLIVSIMKKYICLRDDDTSFFTNPGELIDGYGEYWGKIPVTLGVVPFSHGSQNLMYELEVNPDKYKALREWELKATAEQLSEYHKLHPLGDNLELVQELKKQVSVGMVEIAQHGVSHRYNEYGPETTSSQIALPTIRDGKEYLSKLFGNDVVTYIPPSNTIDLECAKYLKGLGMNLLTSGGVQFDSLHIKITEHVKDPLFLKSIINPHFIKSVIGHTYPMPLQKIAGLIIARSITYNNFDDQDEIYNKVKKRLDDTGFASIATHYMLFDLKGVHGEHPEYRHKYHDLISRLEAIEDVSFVTASDYISRLSHFYYNK